MQLINVTVQFSLELVTALIDWLTALLESRNLCKDIRQEYSLTQPTDLSYAVHKTKITV